MFALRIFGPFSAQRRALLAAQSFASIELHSSTRLQLEELERAYSKRVPVLRRSLSLFTFVLSSIRLLILENIFLNSLSALLVLAAIIIVRNLVNPSSTLTLALIYIGLFLVLKFVQAAVDLFLRLRAVQMHRAVQSSIFRLIFGKLFHMEGESGRFSKGQLKTLMGADVNAVEDFMSASLMLFIPPAVSTIILAPVLYGLLGPAGVVALAATLMILPLSGLGTLAMRYFQRIAQRVQDDLTTAVGEWVKNIRLTRFLGWQEAISREVIALMRRFIRLSALRHSVAIIVYSASHHWSIVPLISIFVFERLSSESVNLIELFSAYWILDHLGAQLSHVPHAFSQFGAALASAARIRAFVNTEELRRFLLPGKGDVAEADFRVDQVLLREVNLSYGEHPALRGISLAIRLDERTAIVGRVGSGKSSLIELLVGERHPTSGRIELVLRDGRHVPLWREDIYDRFRNLLAYTPQQAFISNTTLRENIDLEGISSDDELEQAVTEAQLKPDIELLPLGLGQEIGEAGINLSGGQKQRVSIARGFLSERPFFFMDDPLSAVDPRTERKLFRAIAARSKGLVLVSHRLGELSRCDRVIVLAFGNVVEDGDPKILSRDPNSRYSAFLREVNEHG